MARPATAVEALVTVSYRLSCGCLRGRGDPAPAGQAPRPGQTRMCRFGHGTREIVRVTVWIADGQHRPHAGRRS